MMKAQWITNHSSSDAVEHVKLAIEDSYKRLIQPSVEREIRTELTEKAEAQAIHIFSENLRNLLIATTFKRKSNSRR